MTLPTHSRPTEGAKKTMHSFYAIYRKEMRQYFVSPIAYVVIGVFLFLAALFFNLILSGVIQNAMQMEMESMRFGMPPEIDMPGQVMRAFFGLLSTLILFIIPMLTMGLYSEERKRGTMELLMTSPISETEIVLGKFLASLSLFAIMLIPTLSYLIFLFVRSEPMPPWRLLAAGYAGVVLLGGSLLALGSFISSLTENQLIAAVLTFAAFLFVWVLDVGRNATGGIGAVLSYLSVIRHYEDFTRGIVDTSSLIYYGSFIFLFVFLTVRSVDSMRWRRA
ncbi:MAG: ABC transporter permease [Candidatus Acidiferrales bacterium]